MTPRITPQIEAKIIPKIVNNNVCHKPRMNAPLLAFKIPNTELLSDFLPVKSDAGAPRYFLIILSYVPSFLIAAYPLLKEAKSCLFWPFLTANPYHPDAYGDFAFITFNFVPFLILYCNTGKSPNVACALSFTTSLYSVSESLK